MFTGVHAPKRHYKEMSVWDEGSEELLISLIRDRPALYDVTQRLYSNRAVKAVLWQEIGTQLLISQKEIKRRWESLRTQYGRYKKLLAPPGSCGAIRTGRQQWILSRLQFLEPHTFTKWNQAPRETPADGDWPPDSIIYFSDDVLTHGDEPSISGAEPRPGTPEEKPIISGAESRLSTPDRTASISGAESRPSTPEQKPSISELESRSSTPEVKPNISGLESTSSTPEEKPIISGTEPWSGTPEEKQIISRTEPWSSAPEEKPIISGAEPRSSAPVEEPSISLAEPSERPVRGEPWPSTSRELRGTRHWPKRRRKMLEEKEPCDDDAGTDLLGIIGKTLERLASQQELDDDISTYCKSLETRMRKLPQALLPHFQHEVENCLFRYLTWPVTQAHK